MELFYFIDIMGDGILILLFLLLVVPVNDAMTLNTINISCIGPMLLLMSVTYVLLIWLFTIKIRSLLTRGARKYSSMKLSGIFEDKMLETWYSTYSKLISTNRLFAVPAEGTRMGGKCYCCNKENTVEVFPNPMLVVASKGFFPVSTCIGCFRDNLLVKLKDKVFFLTVKERHVDAF